MTTGDLWQSLRKAFPLFASLLAVGGSGCAVCGNRCEPGRQGAFGSLCKRCFRSIPWIARVYCPVCGRPERCPDCARRTRTAFVANRSAVRYDATIREWLALYKYRGHEALEPLLGDLLTAAYRGLAAERFREAGPRPVHAVIPVPVSEARLLERGFNQAERLAARLGEAEGIPFFDALRRTRHSAKQSAKTRGARLRDTRNLFKADEAELALMLATAGRDARYRLVLVDDIYTTGSTANACAQALADGIGQAAPGLRFDVYVLTVARS
ncbi:comF family protein [Paenibacillus sp. UNC496MF]|uniref:ComF family protein n=1 Tax=Paenibacillus sp. UNC496MF TaxID=1502753 RepID=UPI0008EC93FD|nr:ComF family protein [Paenibacillus sp. UNC496MF]SFJ26701.1 comF family protein [Paenibacillus sp. UNC496MF]